MINEIIKRIDDESIKKDITCLLGDSLVYSCVDFKYSNYSFCVDQRDCKYKEVIENRQYCKLYEVLNGKEKKGNLHYN